ncbi:MAG: hypothetical protein H7222_17755 [Methylotenera sp.]|nr:hypothetical protein [Oligoflexia bacterium]
MKKMILILALSTLFLQFSVWANPVAARDPKFRTQDTDLSPGRSRFTDDVRLDLPLDQVSNSKSTAVMSIEVVREVHGKLLPVEGLAFTLPGNRGVLAQTDARGIATFQTCPSALKNGGLGGTPSLQVTLNHSFFGVVKTRFPRHSEAYRISVSADCGQNTLLTFKADSPGGQALGIWQIGWKAYQKITGLLGAAVWRNRIEMAWPQDGDFYSFHTVHLTRGDQWDVVGHELGHGVYDLGDLGSFGGGSHKIDECYSSALALSEGWASFFSAWLSIDPKDPDARFEFMVPRRAPITIENVPADVCVGETNEWRVTAFFWDLIDLHEDGERAQETFVRLWKALAGKKVGSAKEARIEFEKAGIDKDLLSIAWALNFKTAD